MLLFLFLFLFSTSHVRRFASDMQALYGQFLTGRATKCINFLKGQNANFFKWSQPKYSLQNGQVVAPGTTLDITTDAGCKVYYTKTGADPRLDGT
jgi:hypothetical protein